MTILYLPKVQEQGRCIKKHLFWFKRILMDDAWKVYYRSRTEKINTYFCEETGTITTLINFKTRKQILK